MKALKIFFAVIYVRLVTKSQGHIVEELITDFYKESRINLNIIIDLMEPPNLEFQDIVATIQHPKLLINFNHTEMRHLYKSFNMQCLTIAVIDEEILNSTMALMDLLLWKKHFTPIIIWYETKNEDIQMLYELFGRCWQQGYTDVVVWWQNTLYTFKPYPTITIVPVNDLWHWRNFSLLTNFQQYPIRVIVVDFPPRCFSFLNRQGQLIRTGYYYKLIENFIRFYNGSIQHDFKDMWSSNFIQGILESVRNNRFDFVASRFRVSEQYIRSDTIDLGNVYLMVPSSNEVHQSLYILLSFNQQLWIITGVLLVIFAMLIYFVRYRSSMESGNLVKSFIAALKVIIFLTPEGFEYRTLLNYQLKCIFFFTGLFVTYLYSCSLYSIYSLRIYEPELKLLQDIEKLNLKFLVHAEDLSLYDTLENIPPIIFERFISDNNTALFVNRGKLNMVYIYSGFGDIIQYLLFQQIYLKRPIATYIPEPFYTQPTFIPILHRMPWIDHFNRYLGYVKQSGILNKFIADSQMDGIMSGDIQFFREEQQHRSLVLATFQYGFLLWFMGLFGAFMVFLCEIYQRNILKKFAITVFNKPQ
ncbi:uncharacterized protein LOC106093041 [Stomoxys calcitrans]|uniref:uncharacterized protein LOC106093041 n=1 Tax=Stomoxys calcitrans TaxID=35570 RepID=UPI0027E28DBA|nr:uncharacterized protein LOC106093041 [Stomoxys calcitrans]